MEDFVIVDGVLERFLGDEEIITVPLGVHEIAQNAFRDCKKIQQIVIQKGVTNIGGWAFANCRKLHTLVIPETVNSVGMAAFNGCWNITELYMPGVTDLNKDNFYDCRYLQTLIVPCLDYENAAIQQKKEQALRGFVRNRRCFTDEKVIASYRKALSRNRKTLLPEVFRDDRVEILYDLDAVKKITSDNIDSEYLAPAKAADAQQCIGFLNDWMTKNMKEERSKEKKGKPVEKEAAAKKRIMKDSSEGINGLVFALEGELSYVWDTKQEVKQFLELHGAKLSSSVTTKTDYYVTEDKNAETAKSKKALELGVPVVSMEEFDYIIGRRFKDEGEVQVAVPSWIKEIQFSAFDSHENLERVQINEGVTTIRFCAFDNCKKLSSVTVPDSVKFIDKGAFSSCGAFTIFAHEGSYAEQYATKNNIPFIALDR